jgi:Tol biopolymer transport system component
VAVAAVEFERGADERRSGVFAVSADGSEPPRRLARASDASSPAWSPDGSKLAVLAARDRDRGWRSSAVMVAMAATRTAMETVAAGTVTMAATGPAGVVMTKAGTTARSSRSGCGT